MRIPFEDIFKNTEIYNPISQQTLLSAGKFAQMDPGKTIIDLASGSGYPSLLWTSLFGVHVTGYDIGEKYVAYANTRAKMLNLEEKAQYFCQDLKNFTTEKKYDIVAALGFDVSIYGSRIEALNRFKSMLKSNGTIILAEPYWIEKPVPQYLLKAFNLPQDSFITLQEMQQLLSKQGLKEIWHVSSIKEDWEIYVRPVFLTMQQYINDHPELTQDAQAIIDNFKTEYDAATKYWNMALWVLKPI